MKEFGHWQAEKLINSKRHYDTSYFARIHVPYLPTNYQNFVFKEEIVNAETTSGGK